MNYEEMTVEQIQADTDKKIAAMKNVGAWVKAATVVKTAKAAVIIANIAIVGYAVYKSIKG